MARKLSGQAEDRFGTPDEILAFFVHEFRNPLAVIKGYASVLEESGRSPDPAVVAASIGAIRRAAESLDALVSSLGNASPLPGKAMRLDLAELLASALVEDTVADLTAISDGRTLEISIEDDAVVRVDEVKIRQVLVNLISNAVKFSPRRSCVEVILSRRRGNIQICIVDQGPGVPAERLDELFKKFSRLGSPKNGTGLGLYISRAIARAHGGDLLLGDSDEGCHFMLTLPILQDSAH
jgi:signal transduction histidine kinase